MVDVRGCPGTLRTFYYELGTWNLLLFRLLGIML